MEKTDLDKVSSVRLIASKSSKKLLLIGSSKTKNELSHSGSKKQLTGSSSKKQLNGSEFEFKPVNFITSKKNLASTEDGADSKRQMPLPRRVTDQDELRKNKRPTIVFTSKTGLTTSVSMENQDMRLSNLMANLTGKKQPREQKVFSNKVYVPWYRRYYDILPTEERVQTQPFYEVIEEGTKEKKKKLVVKSKILGPKRTSVEEKEMEIAKKRMRSIHTKETGIMTPITNYLSWVRRRRMKQRKDYDMYRGRWLKFFTPDTKDKLKFMSKAIRKSKARQRFVKVTNAVVCLNTFLSSIKESHYSSHLTLGDISHAAENKKAVNVKKGMFDPSKFKIANKMDESATIPFKVKLVLTKPWYTRTLEEVEEVVEALYSLFIFVRYPENVAKQLARVAWYSRLGKQRPILRQSDEAQCFCFLLSGVVKIFSMTQDEDGHQVEIVHKHITRGQLFGEEDMAHLHALRKVSVTTVASSELMTIDFNDYQASLMTPLGAARIPMHIKIIKKTSYIKKIPLIDILENAIDSLPCMYFPTNSIIVESLKLSDYIFLVLQGECYSASLPLLKPQAEEIIPVEDKKDFSAIFLKSDFNQDYETIRKSMNLKSDRSNEALRRERIFSTIMWTKKMFEDDIKRLCEVALVRPKEELIKGVLPRRILGFYMGADNQAYERSVAEDIVKKMRLYEEGNLEYKQEIQRMRGKSARLNRVLDRLAQMDSRMQRKVCFDDRQSMNSDLEGSEIADQLQAQLDELDAAETNEEELDVHTPKETHSEIQPAVEEAEPVGILNEKKSEGDVKVKSPSLRSSTIRVKTSGHVRFGSDSQLSPGSKHASISSLPRPDSSHTRSPTTPTTPTKSNSSVRTSFDDAIEASKGLEPKKSVTYLTELKHTRPSVLDEVWEEERDSFEEQRPSDASDFGEDKEKKHQPVRRSKVKKTKEQPTPNTNNIISSSDSYESFDEARCRSKNMLRYKKIAVHRKNQLIGDNYVDYNDGKFRDQMRDLALVSGGVEVVMIAKWFLLHHLYHSW